MSAIVSPSSHEELGGAVVQLLNEARHEDAQDRRSDVRYPYFRPLTVETEDGRQMSAFSRDISRGGLGLLAAAPLAAESTLRVVVRDETGGRRTFVVRATWCRPCGDGWYLAGTKFLELEE